MRDRVAGLGVELAQARLGSRARVGIAQGYATIGAIGFEGRLDYGAIGTVTNLAARLCGEAEGGQILISARVASAVESHHRRGEPGPAHPQGPRAPGPDLERARPGLI